VIAVAGLLFAAACGSDDGVSTAGSSTLATTVPEGTTEGTSASSGTSGSSVTSGSSGSSTSTGTSTTGGATTPGTADPMAGASLDPRSGAAAGDAVALLTGVRAARNAGFDRVVFEFAGSNRPKWSVRYVDGPFTADGSGEPVAVAGDAFLEVRMEGGSGVDLDTGEVTYDGPARVAGAGTVRVTEVVRTGDFEAVMTWVIGSNRGVPFRVTVLTGPSRLVVDLA